MTVDALSAVPFDVEAARFEFDAEDASALRWNSLRDAARLCLEESDLDHKVRLSRRVFTAWRKGDLPLVHPGHEALSQNPEPSPIAGMPASLRLTEPTRVPRRGFGSRSGLAAFVHAIAHIEWNAINLAWDAVWRFPAMPRDFHDDWSRVAVEEAGHFAMLRARLRELGSDYGELPAHDGLWQTAEATRANVLERMALVPRVLEARGIDVTPALITKLRRAGDERTASILDVVLRDEVGHVRTGSRWFHALCEERGLEPAAAFAAAVRRHFRGRPQPVTDAGIRRLRIEAGFREDELDALAVLAGQR